MIVIYTPKVTNRIKYTFDFVFNQYFGVSYKVVETLIEEHTSDVFYLSYSTEKVIGWYTIFQDTLLLEEEIKPQQLFISKWDELPVLFGATESYDLPFDIFSAIFYLLTRYEEYVPHDKDAHGRYMSANSILANPVFSFQPIVEIWLQQWQQDIERQAPQLRFKKRQATYIPTFDIDHAYQYLGRNWFHFPPNITKKECWQVLLGRQKDPYDSYDFILHELTTLQCSPKFFILTGNASSYDTKISVHSNKMRCLLPRLQQAGEVGIHPSYGAMSQHSIAAEKQQLEEVLAQNVTISRQHFLRISFPDYYPQLIAAGIEKDYSLSYPDVVGCRAGCSVAFPFFDLVQNRATSLVLQPSSWMDATYVYYVMKSLNEIILDTKRIIKQLSIFNGNFVPIFHNDVLAREAYRQLLTSMHTLIKEENYD